jgi:hypothetical protein
VNPNDTTDQGKAAMQEFGFKAVPLDEPGAPTPRRIAERLGDMTTALDQAVAQGDLGAINNAVAELGRLRRALDAWDGGLSAADVVRATAALEDVRSGAQQETEAGAHDEQVEKLERADGKLCKAVFTFLDALSQFEETTDVDELYRNVRQNNPGIIISKSVIRAWAAQKGETD